jgi:MoaA/NifB/PqqE/SkfB family radical SAM enzyme
MVNKHSNKNLAEFISRTGNLLIHLLDRCNLSCKHCYLNASQFGQNFLPLDFVKRTINEAQDIGLKSIQFSGGEPFLYSHIYEILKLTKGKNFHVTVSTNSTLIDTQAAELLSEINANVVTSIDGPAVYHDRFRGKKGSFFKAEAGIQRLVDHGVPVKIVMTVSEDNFNYIEWCAEWAYERKADTVQFQPLQKIGRGKEIENSRLSNERLNDLFIRLNDLAVFYAPKGLKIKMTYQSRDFMIAHPCEAFVCNGKNCHRMVEKELKKIVIREDGSILPELVDIDKKFSIGNLYNDTLRNNILNFLNNGYYIFDQLCREVYNDTVPNYPSPLIPWNEILSERSKIFNNERIRDARFHHN